MIFEGRLLTSTAFLLAFLSTSHFDGERDTCGDLKPWPLYGFCSLAAVCSFCFEFEDQGGKQHQVSCTYR